MKDVQKYIKGFKFATEFAKVVKYAIEYAKRSSMGHSWNGDTSII